MNMSDFAAPTAWATSTLPSRFSARMRFSESRRALSVTRLRAGQVRRAAGQQQADRRSCVGVRAREPVKSRIGGWLPVVVAVRADAELAAVCSGDRRDERQAEAGALAAA